MAAIDPLLPFLKQWMSGAEIGVQAAESSVKILSCGCELLCIDPWTPYAGYLESCDHNSLKEKAHKRIEPYLNSGLATIFVGKSEDAAKLVSDTSLDFVFIDGNHSYEYVFSDCITWWDKVAPGGFLCGHDYEIIRPPTHEVKRAVDLFSSLVGGEVEIYAGCWLIRK